VLLVELLIRIHTKLSLYFSDIYTNFYVFWNFEKISENFSNGKELKKINSDTARI
jgi:hypothetical protein